MQPEVQSSTPCHAGYQPSWATSISPVEPHNINELSEAASKVPGAGGSQSVLLGQEREISYQTFFLLGVIFSEKMKQTKSSQQNLNSCDRKRNFALLPLNFSRLRGSASPGDILTALRSRNLPPSKCCLAPFIRSNHHLLTNEI